MRLKAGQVVRVDRQSAPGGNDRLLTPGQFLDYPSLPLTKDPLAVLSKNVTNPLPGSRLDDLVSVQKGEMEQIGRHPTHARFTTAHESNQGKIADGTRASHIAQLPLKYNRTVNL